MCEWGLAVVMWLPTAEVWSARWPARAAVYPVQQVPAAAVAVAAVLAHRHIFVDGPCPAGRTGGV